MPVTDTCLRAEVSVDSASASRPQDIAFDYRFFIESDGLLHKLASGTLHGGEPSQENRTAVSARLESPARDTARLRGEAGRARGPRRSSGCAGGPVRHLKRRAFPILVLLFSIAVVANAVAWGIRFDDRMLEYRPFDYGWELLLPWEAREGRWCGRDFVYPIGPLWQLLAALPTFGGAFSAPRAVAGMHLIFPRCRSSLRRSVLESCSSDPTTAASPSPDSRCSDFTTTCGASARCCRSPCSAPTRPVSSSRTAHAGGSRRWSGRWSHARQPSLSDTGLLGIVSIVAMSIYQLVTTRFDRQALVYGLRVLAATAGFQVLLAVLLALSGGSYARLAAGVLEIVGAYSTAMGVAPRGYYFPERRRLRVARAFAAGVAQPAFGCRFR